MNPFERRLEIQRFLTRFRRGEQVFVGFRGGSTHGYVSSITQEGFGVIQIGKPKEYIYDWEHFEFVCTPGFRVKQLTEFESVHLFRVVLRQGNPLPDKVGSLEVTINSVDDLLLPNPFGFAAEELKLKLECGMGKDSVQVNARVQVGEDVFEGKRFVFVGGRDDARGYYVTLPDDYELPELTRVRGTRPSYDATEENRWPIDLVAARGKLRCTIAINSRRDMEALRAGEKLEWREPQPYRAFGDPWLTDDPAIYLGDGAWQSSDGYLLTNRHGDLYLGAQ